MTQEPISKEDRARITELLEKATPGPWAARPNEFDDWGFVRASNGWAVAVSRAGREVSEDEFAAHRRAKTDPYGPNSLLIAEARTALPAYEAALQAAEAKIAEQREALTTIEKATLPWREPSGVVDALYQRLYAVHNIARAALSDPTGKGQDNA